MHENGIKDRRSVFWVRPKLFTVFVELVLSSVLLIAKPADIVSMSGFLRDRVLNAEFCQAEDVVGFNLLLSESTSVRLLIAYGFSEVCASEVPYLKNIRTS